MMWIIATIMQIETTQLRKVEQKRNFDVRRVGVQSSGEHSRTPITAMETPHTADRTTLIRWKSGEDQYSRGVDYLANSAVNG